VRALSWSRLSWSRLSWSGPAALLARVRPALAVVTALGWGFVAAAVALAVAGALLGWAEPVIVAVALAVLVLLAVLLTLGGAGPRLEVSLSPPRVGVGASSRADVAAVAGRAVPPSVVELPVGETVAVIAVPALRRDARFDVPLEIPTSRRGVIVVGPATTVRGDPFGLARRVVSQAAETELFVHPRVLPLPPLDAGLVRDLDGRATSDPSASDLDFHTLRPYLPGDERRHVHWRSSARARATGASTTLMVKGYTDTRRSHLGLVVDARPEAYAGEDAFEDAIVAAASVAVRALTDEMDVTVVAGRHAVDRGSRARTLDTFARAQEWPAGLPALTARLVTMAPATSIVLLVTGGHTPVAELRRATTQLGPQITLVALRADPDRASSVASAHGLTVLSLSRLEDLSRLVTAGALA
jgi:uncharacterized protein (DUF58 family)